MVAVGQEADTGADLRAAALMSNVFIDGHPHRYKCRTRRDSPPLVNTIVAVLTQGISVEEKVSSSASMNGIPITADGD